MGQSGEKLGRAEESQDKSMCHPMKLLLVASVFLSTLGAAPPPIGKLQEDTTSEPQEEIEDDIITTVAPDTITNAPAPLPKPSVPELLSGKERLSLIGHLGEVDLKKVDKLILTPRQQLALTQELELLKLGLPSFHDPTPWERLTQKEQLNFNEKYLALSPELQEFAKNQFVSASDDILLHAFRMFNKLDLELLTKVLQREADIINGKAVIKEEQMEKDEEETKVTVSEELPDQKEEQQMLLEQEEPQQKEETTTETTTEVIKRPRKLTREQLAQQQKQQRQLFKEAERQRIQARRKVVELPRSFNGFNTRRAN